MECKYAGSYPMKTNTSTAPLQDSHAAIVDGDHDWVRLVIFIGKSQSFAARLAFRFGRTNIKKPLKWNNAAVAA